jgi:hypothetical protein
MIAWAGAAQAVCRTFLLGNVFDPSLSRAAPPTPSLEVPAYD